jgi:AraC-like DNA-binding protein
MRTGKSELKLSRRESKEFYNPSISIITSILEPSEYSICLEKNHAIGIAPDFATTVPTSYDFAPMQDFVWAPNTFGFLPITMAQSGAILQRASTTNILLSDALFASAVNEGVSAAHFNLRNIVAAEDKIASSLISAMGEIARNKETEEHSLLVESLGSTLAVRILQKLGALKKVQPHSVGRMGRVMEYINDNLGRKMTLEELAQVACLSQFHFARQFKAAYNETPHEYVTRRRVETALRHIRQGAMALSMIAAVCGFCSQAHMTKTVRQSTGHTPTQHQRMAGIRVTPG